MESHDHFMFIKMLQGLSKQGRVPILFSSLLSLHILTPSISDDLVQVLASLFKETTKPYRYLFGTNFCPVTLKQLKEYVFLYTSLYFKYISFHI